MRIAFGVWLLVGLASGMALAQSQADSLGVGGWAEARTAAPN